MIYALGEDRPRASTIVSLEGVTIHHRRLHFRNIGWRLAWWAAWLSFVGGIAVAAFVCRHP